MHAFRTARRVLLTALALSLLLPSLAAAGRIVPPGLSGANQYTETLPGPGGNEQTGPSNGSPTSPKKTLGEENAGRLEALGPEGREAARLAATGGGSRGNGGGPGGVQAPGSGDGGASQVIGDITGASTGEGGMGPFLVVVIVAIAAAAAIYAYSRRRGTTPGDTGTSSS